MKKVILVLTMALIISNTTCVKAVDNVSFNDVPNNHWAKGNIEKLVGLGIVDGYEDGSFKPDKNINVDAFIKLVVTGLGYTDIKNAEGYWATNYINKAVELSIIQDGQFDSYNRIISREEMASITARALGQVEDMENENKAENLDFIKSCILDFNIIDNKYQQNVVDCYSIGLITGKPNGFDPKGNATRAEAVTVIVRLLDESCRKPIFIPPMITEKDIQKDEKGVYYDFYKYVDYNRFDTKRYKGRIYEMPEEEATAIKLLYAMDKVYRDNEGYVHVGEAGRDGVLSGVDYSCIDKIDRTCDGTTTPIVNIINHTEVSFSILNRTYQYSSPYNISFFYKMHDLTYMERYKKYEKILDTILYYLYEDEFQVMKKTVEGILRLGENMDADRYRYTIKMNDREMFVEMDQQHRVSFHISIKGGKIEHYYQIKENKPDFNKIIK
ncbi:S-layer homology domain-containing protein [Vallitalea guaymasensis]|uniref:S-layer homology domain-containing protein n=1 Tax=Vallitalea guaymasensis TaxID=1185412 RepID=UPI0023532659|nr:S-layer homology domain-containing protein [Vallitalea guaymasensis]